MPNEILPSISSDFHNQLDRITSTLGVSRDILASTADIRNAWSQLPEELNIMSSEHRDATIAKMCVAIAAGLFDSALNYVWNSTITALRIKIKEFGFSTVNELLQLNISDKTIANIQDFELLKHCLELNLIGEDAYFHLNQCRDIRNNFSVAHPSIGQITKMQLLSFIDNCSRYALSEDSRQLRGVDTKQFLQAIKSTNNFSGEQYDYWVTQLRSTNGVQLRSLVKSLFGLYCDPNSNETTRQKALFISNQLKDLFTFEIESDFLDTIAGYINLATSERLDAAKIYIEKISLLYILGNEIQHSIFSSAINGLLSVHLGMNNFYSEPPFSKRLSELVKNQAVPDTVKQSLVYTVFCCYIGNGYGVSWAALQDYEEMIRNFSPMEISILLSLITKGFGLLEERKNNMNCKPRIMTALTDLINPDSISTSIKTDYERLLRSFN